MPPGGLRATAVEIAPVAVTRVLDEGDVVDLGDRAFDRRRLVEICDAYIADRR